jgi:3-methyladenine DNA glycosylase Mpg
MYAKCKLIWVCLEIVLVSAQDRCTVCAERTIGSKIIWTQPMVLQGDVVEVEAHLGPFRDS